jgi:hypothetical protein
MKKVILSSAIAVVLFFGGIKLFAAEPQECEEAWLRCMARADAYHNAGLLDQYGYDVYCQACSDSYTDCMYGW